MGVLTTQVLDLIRTFVISLMLTYAAYSDIKTRRVSNKVWLIFSPIAIALIFLDIILEGNDFYMLLLAAINIIIGITIAFSAFYLGIMGGADAKAIILLSVLLPRWPYYTLHPIEIIPPIISALVLSSLIALVYFPVILLLNIVRGNIEIPLSFFGIKLNKDQVLKKKDYYIPLYRVSKEKGTLELKLRGLLPSEEEIEEVWKKIKESSLKEIWVTPGIPFMVYLFIGTLVTMVYGDIVVRMLLRAFHIL